MKKGPKRHLHIFFWLLIAAGALWVTFVPHHHHVAQVAVTVPVIQPQEKPEPPITAQAEYPFMPAPRASQPAEKPAMPTGEEMSLPSEAVLPSEKQVVRPTGGKPRIAIVIDDVGPDMKGSERAIRELPPTVTLSFLPYATRLREQAKEAREGGHEMLLHMPMEPLGHEDPGPGALLVDLPMRDLQQRFETALASFTGFDGVNNHMGSKFTAWPDGMTMVVDELRQRHLFYLDSRTNPKSVGKQIADQKGLPSIGRDIFLDDDQSPDVIRAQLTATEKVAQRRGYAVAIGHPHAATLNALEAWIADAQRRGFVLVPIHDLIGQ
jgi:polysaccharide deacetylase 2 family uncharacterized protein YibQ